MVTQFFPIIENVDPRTFLIPQGDYGTIKITPQEFGSYVGYCVSYEDIDCKITHINEILDQNPQLMGNYLTLLEIVDTF